MMRVTDGGPDLTGGVAVPVGTVPCRYVANHLWTAARVGTDVHWWRCTSCDVLATTAELDLADVPNHWGSVHPTTTTREARA